MEMRSIVDPQRARRPRPTGFGNNLGASCNLFRIILFLVFDEKISIFLKLLFLSALAFWAHPKESPPLPQALVFLGRFRSSSGHRKRHGS
jgi:hypothetical protein